MTRLAPRLGFGFALALLLLAGSSFALPPRTLTRDLLSWNVGTLNPLEFRLPERFEDRVVNGIFDVDAEVVALQELGSTTQALRLQAALAARGRPYWVETEDNHPGRSDGRMIAVFYRGEVLSERRTFVSSSGYQALALVFDSGWTLVNAHGPATSHKPRRAYFEELSRWITNLPGTVVLAGDLNLGPRHGAGVSAVLPWARRHDRETFRDLAQGFAARTSGDSTTFYGFALDHVLVQRGSVQREEQHRGYRKFPMDHRPLEVRFEVDLSAPAAPVTSATTRGAAGALAGTP